jgi:very-short-patch-repair endonuclease
VYAVGHLAPCPLGDETAALLALPNGAALSHRSAAAIWRMLGPDSGERPIEVTIRDAHLRPIGGVRVHRSRTLTPTDLRIREDVPVTSPARTLLDLSDVVTERELELAYDRALVARILGPRDVAGVLSRPAGRRGRRALQTLIERERGPAVTRSAAEERFLDLIRSANLPEPLVNVRVHGYEVDFLWPDKLAVEIDGYRFHSTRRSFDHDHRKDAVLRGVGLPVVRFTWEQITGEAVAVVALVAQSLAAANGL